MRKRRFRKQSCPRPAWNLGVASVIEVTAPRSCFVASLRCPAKGFRYLALAARSPKVGSCAVKPRVLSSRAGDAGAQPRGFGAGVVPLGVTGGVSGPWTCLAPVPVSCRNCPLVPSIAIFLCCLFFLVLKSHQAGSGAGPLSGVCLFLWLLGISLF